MADDENRIRALLEDMAAGYRAKDAQRIVGELQAYEAEYGPIAS